MNLGYNINNGFKITTVDLSDSTSVAAAATNDQTLTPPTGKIYQIINIYATIPDPAGSAAGTHKLQIQWTPDKTNYYGLASLTSTTGNAIGIDYDYFVADSAETPSNAREQFLFCNGRILASNDHPIRFRYTNSTDVAQAGTRTIKVLVKVYNENG